MNLKELFKGILVALFTVAGSLFLYLEYFSEYGLQQTWSFIRQGNLEGSILSLAAIPNLFVFFIFLRKRQDDRARGVLLVTILMALTTLVLKVF